MTRLIVTTISLYVQMSNHYAVQLKYNILYITYNTIIPQHIFKNWFYTINNLLQGYFDKIGLINKP